MRVVNRHDPPAIVVEVRYEYADGSTSTTRYLATPDYDGPARQVGHRMWRVSTFVDGFEPSGAAIAVEAPDELTVWAALRAIVASHEREPGAAQRIAQLGSDEMSGE